LEPTYSRANFFHIAGQLRYSDTPTEKIIEEDEKNLMSNVL